MPHEYLVHLLPALLLTGVALAQTAPWQPAPEHLPTRWTPDVTPENAWPEYPRPQMVRPDWVNLNGLWQYAIAPQEEDRPSRWDGWILVPFCVESALSGVARSVRPDEALWYRRTFEEQRVPEGRRLLLHFGAVDWHARVWINGAFVGEHRGGYDPFSFDITDALGEGPQELLVRAWDPTDQGYQPRGKQVLDPKGIWYTAVTGIWQTAWMETVPAAHVVSLRIVPDLDTSSVTVTVRGSRDGLVEIEAAAGAHTVAAARGRTGEPISLVLSESHPWSPDDPFLYGLRVSLSTPSSRDGVESYFGLRKIEVRPDASGTNRLFLNNEPRFQFGPLDQGWWPDGLYTAPTDAALRHDVEITKALGFNMARKHVKIEPARWYHWCDRLGLLVWQDMPSGDAYIHGDMPDMTRSPESATNFERELRAMVDGLGNHPSIVMWVPYNEGWGQWDTARVCRLIKTWDPTRLVNNTSGWTDRGVGDVNDIHRYPGPAAPPLEADRAAVLGEFGGLGLPIEGHTLQDQENWGYRQFDSPEGLTAAYVNLLQSLRPLIGRGLAAAVYTQTSDVETEVNGLMTYDRAMVKMDAGRVAEAARRLYGPPPVVTVILPTSQVRPQRWRYVTTPPAGNWRAEDFDDASWTKSSGGFGTTGTPGAIVGTTWDSGEIFLRKSFAVDSIGEGRLFLRVHHDEDFDVSLNGVSVLSQTGWVTDYVDLPLPDTARTALRIGRNTIAIRCRQTGGGQYIDAGIVLMVEPIAPRTPAD